MFFDLPLYFEKLKMHQSANNIKYPSKEDLEKVAESLGFDMQYVYQAKENYIKEANDFLNNRKYQEANDSFENALLLDNQNLEIFLGLAIAKSELYHSKKWYPNKENAIKYAQKVIDIDPENPKAKYLLDALNQTEKFYDYEQVKIEDAKAANPFKILLFASLSIIAVFVFIWIYFNGFSYGNTTISQYNKENTEKQTKTVQINKLTSYFVSKIENETCFWLIYRKNPIANETKSDYFAKIIIPNKGNEKIVTLAQNELVQNMPYETMQVFDKYVFFSTYKNYEIRDVQTGEIVESLEDLPKKYPIIKSKIKQVRKVFKDLVLLGASKKEIYVYNFVTKEIALVNGQNPKKISGVQWHFNFTQSKKQMQEFVCSKFNFDTNIFEDGNGHYVQYEKSKSISNENIQSLKQGTYDKNLTKISQTQKVCENSEFLYGDAQYMLASYMKDDNIIYFCVDAHTGNIIWENDFSETKTFDKLQNNNITRFEQKNGIMTIVQEEFDEDYEDFVINFIEIDLQKGVILNEQELDVKPFLQEKN